MWKAVERASHLAAIGAFALGIVWFLYTLLSSDKSQSFDARAVVTWGAAMKTWLPPAIIAVVLCAAVVLQIIAVRMRARLSKSEASTTGTQTTSTEISALNESLTQAREALAGKRQQMKEVERERNRYKVGYDEEHSAALRLKTLNEQYDMQIKKLTSDAEEARREKLAAASNLDGVQTDRNNYRTWYNELAWLDPSIKPQKEDISNYVKVIAARPCVLSLKERRIVVIDLVIRNDSFFDIRIKPSTVAGQLSTNTKGLLNDPAKAFVDLNHPPIENLKPTKEAMFAIIQPLLRSEAEEIEDAIAKGSDGYFWLGTLNIPISVQNAEPLDVDSKPLRMNSNIEHVYFREFGSLTNDGEVITPQELLRSIDALPFPERARIYRELSKAYDESLWRLNEAKENKDPEELANEAISRNTNNA